MKELDYYKTQACVEGFIRNMERAGIPQTLSVRLLKLQEEGNETVEASLIHMNEPSEATRDHLEEEVGDLAITLAGLANYFGIDLGQAVNKALTKVHTRINGDVINELQSQGLYGQELYQTAKKAQQGK